MAANQLIAQEYAYCDLAGPKAEQDARDRGR
ncbi:hypothetical protein M2164_000085 [Streptomyces sp. SAI-208]|nr:hypothetical protein [Streptomyces sp. SAI-208]